MALPGNELRLRMFVALCDYAFDEIEPEFGDDPMEQLLYSLWIQFRLVFIQAKKRAIINSINGRKGGRPTKANETDGFVLDKQKKHTTTYTNTEDVNTAAADLYGESSVIEFCDDNDGNSII